MSIYSETIQKFLNKEKPNRFSAKELMNTLSIPEQAFYHHIKKLIKENEVDKVKGYYSHKE